FVRRIEKFLNSKGKKLIGWDEILEGGLAPNAAVMSWRGTEGGIAAARQKHYVVMSPGKPCYFDHYQSKDRSKEPLAIGGYNPLDSVYAYNPTPKVLSSDEQKYILGAQGNVWTEYIQNEKQVEYMAVPRMCALAEVLWTQPEKKNYTNFIIRLKQHRKLLDKMNVNYSRHFLTPKHK
ncbi:MAG: family 20 glycosylhydrolase, partial [Bacteroidia bacterium]